MLCLISKKKKVKIYTFSNKNKLIAGESRFISGDLITTVFQGKDDHFLRWDTTAKIISYFCHLYILTRYCVCYKFLDVDVEKRNDDRVLNKIRKRPR